MNSRSGLILGVVVWALAGGLMAKPPEDKDKGKPAHVNTTQSASHGDRDADDLLRITLDRETARRWADDYHLAGQAALPPGIRKNLARGKPLPPGIAKRNLPTPYLGRLPVYDGYDWTMAGRDLVLVQAATGIVADVLADVFD